MFRGGANGLRSKLQKLTMAQLKDLVSVHQIPCQRISRKSKPQLIATIIAHTENRHAAQSGSDLAAA
jgi:hypothetical protein